MHDFQHHSERQNAAECPLVINNESREYENAPKNGFSIATVGLTTIAKARDHVTTIFLENLLSY